MKRASRQRKSSRSAVRGTTTAPSVISFRPDKADSELLFNKAWQQGLSSHQLAHDYVVSILHEQPDGRAMEAKIANLEQRIKQLRDELCLVAEVLLNAAGKVTREKAAEWVDANLKPESTGRS